MALLYGFAAPCLFGVVFLHKAKQGRLLCADSTHKSLPHQRTAPIHHESAKAVYLLSFLLVMGIAMCFLWEIFFKVFGFGQSDVR